MEDKDCLKKALKEFYRVRELLEGVKFGDAKQFLESKGYDCDYNEDETLIDVSNKYSITTITNIKGKAVLIPTSIEVWNGLDCLGIYSVNEIKEAIN